MPLICYDHSLRFHKAAKITLQQANAIIDEYAAKGFNMTLRQLYYQFIARGLLPENSLAQYKRLGDIMSRGRIAGLVDWNSLTDNNRYVRDNHFAPDGEYIPHLQASAESWTINWWIDQEIIPMFMIEKDALAGTIDGICGNYQVPYIACRGYMSQSEQWRMGMRFRHLKKDGYKPIVFHLGDHDPSGIDMTRDNEERLWMFGGHVEVIRIALNMDQVEEFNPPPNPVKGLDSRSPDYKDKFGEECWELDALDPQFIADLVETNIKSVLDMKKFEERKAENLRQTEEIKALVGTLVWPPEEPPEVDVYEWRDPWA